VRSAGWAASQFFRVAWSPCDGVWTSCSWHYSVSHHRPLADFIGRMQQLVRPGGLLGAEFMMPIVPRHFMTEHYTSPERLSHHFAAGWAITGPPPTRGALDNRTHSRRSASLAVLLTC
jgi:hypothetical protein